MRRTTVRQKRLPDLVRHVRFPIRGVSAPEWSSSFFERRLRRGIMACGVPLLALIMAACQSSSIDEAFDEERGIVAKVSPGMETVGEGAVTIGMVTGLAGPRNDLELRYLSGARFAASQLGTDLVRLSIYNAQPTKSGIDEALSALRDAGAKLIIGPSDEAQLGAIAQHGNGDLPPVIALVSNDATRGKGVYAFVSNEVDSAIEVAAYAIGAGRKDILLVHPAGAPEDALARLGNAIVSKGGRVSGEIRIEANRDDPFADAQKEITGARTVLLAPGFADPGAIAASLKASRMLSADAWLLATPEIGSGAGASGSYFCRFDRLEIGGLAREYQAEYGVAMSDAVAYGFDAAALSIGLVRTNGASALSAEGLKSPSGFQGLMGAFRFSASGSVERNCSIYRAAQTGFELIDPAPKTF
ncbi:ABC transporter substrate-binding protein [Rhizobiales bacterium]|uniref:ABC transporter substrate-binding protein n=1 Tax=Hongsoonwoonella zoysiae TaxID=2821844 RepID=UPI0015614545|nr:ABC transporter substrate-binding protein [Hongsoonwoonella zoysiae]NRG16407.1 ABC transporter substrate-binding protein [Hongsoonwoonella zoysiae]